MPPSKNFTNLNYTDELFIRQVGFSGRVGQRRILT